MPRPPLRLLALAPFPTLLAAGVVWEGWVLAFNADAVATSIGVITVALVLSLAKLTPALAEFLRTCGPLLVDLLGNLRRKWVDTSVQVAANTAEIEAIKAWATATEAQNLILREGLSRALSQGANAEQINSGLGLAGLIGEGFVKDPGQSKAEGGATP